MVTHLPTCLCPSLVPQHLGDSGTCGPGTQYGAGERGTGRKQMDPELALRRPHTVQAGTDTHIQDGRAAIRGQDKPRCGESIWLPVGTKSVFLIPHSWKTLIFCDPGQKTSPAGTFSFSPLIADAASALPGSLSPNGAPTSRLLCVLAAHSSGRTFS